MSELAYLYCLLPAGSEVEVAGLAGMDGARVELAQAGTLQAAWSEVGDEFAEASLNARIRDLDWLSPRAVRHHEVVDALYNRCKPLLPLSFGVIFRSVERLQDQLAARHDELSERLERLRGRDEWNLKLTRDQAVFSRELREVSPELRALRAELETKAPGTRFLLEKKIQNLEAREAQRVSVAVRAEAHSTLAAVAVEAHRDQLSPAAAQEPVRLELRSAYLVDESATDSLQAAVEALAAKYGGLGYTLELSGPWPAFTFARGVQEALG
ncbi:MAG TPA: GvpL/GvpF family gas vesicle protein [Chloroflexota bacterium]|nr:GvpL/GvpF family gas vesicle protein [Chloroflexota bacterium]